MKIKSRGISLIAALAVPFALCPFIFAADTEYDSSTDPLISYSYLEERLAELQEQIDALEEELEADDDIFEALYFDKGDTIYSTGGSLEIILRAGSATVVSSFDSQGLSDMTEGTDLLAGSIVVLDHLLLVPRGDDGRGITITSNGAYVMLKGSYYVVKAS